MTIASTARIVGPSDYVDSVAIRSLANRSTILGLDTEFTGLDYFSPDWRLRLVQVATKSTAYVLDPSKEEQLEAIHYVLENVPEFSTHSEADSLALMVGLGIDITNKVHDTEVMANILWPGPKEEHGLKALCNQHLDAGLSHAEEILHEAFRPLVGAKEGKALTKAQKGRGFALVPLENKAYQEYAGLDAIYDLHLYYYLEDLLYKKNRHKAYPQEQKVRAVATRMTKRGMRVDMDRVEELLGDYGGRHDTAQQIFEATYGFPAKSPIKRAELVLSTGVAIQTRTPKGNYSLGKATVEELAQEHPNNKPIQLLQEVAVTSNVTTFLRSLVGHVEQVGAHYFVHPQYNTLGAVTGRWTATSPAIQTVSGIVRSVFVPRKGNVIVSADLGQIEPRVAVAIAGERNLIPDLLAGNDVYSAGAALAFGNTFSEKQRKQIKRVILGTLYASGVATLVKQARLLDGWLDADSKTVAEVRNLWKKAAPEITEYARELSYLKEVKLPSGRVVPQEAGREYKAINSLCQGAARDALMCRLLGISNGYDQYLVTTLHDELLLDVPESVLVRVVAAIREVMEQGYDGIPTPTDIEIFPDCWGSKGIPWEEFQA